MKRLALLVSSLTIAVGLSAQKDLVISGGHAVASLVCGNQDVYVTGMNRAGDIYGSLGTGNTSDRIVTKWTKVNFPNDASGHSTTMQQVNSGSGSFFIALDCKGQAWGWGGNDVRQTGTGSTANAVTTPTQIKAGDAATTDGHGNIAGVSVVYAGNEAGYAIMNDGRLMAWGARKNFDGKRGLIGDGGTGYDPCPTPVYVKTKVNNDLVDLKNVISVFAGDNGAIALVDDNDDGVGTVYSWGTGANGTLGRNANGGVYTTDGEGLWAMPVIKGDGQPLNNIVAIACGDVFSVALDVDGYVWTWGNNGWHRCCGWGDWLTLGVPSRVVKGNTTGTSNDGTYLLAKSIAAGQVVGMAVTADGKPVVWGYMNDDDPESKGGDNAPNTTSCRSEDVPTYVQYSNNSSSVHKDVIFVNKGDNWAYYGRSDGSIWSWGGNYWGTMGNGNTTGVGYATQIGIASGSTCTFKDPPPSVKLPESKVVCASAYMGEELNCQITLAPNLQGSYIVKWYKDGVLQNTTDSTVANNQTFTTPSGEAGMGTYMVVMKYKGSNIGCSLYDSAYAKMTVSAFEKNFTVPDLSFCADILEGGAYVNTTGKAIYSWYEDQSATTPLATTLGSQHTSDLDLSTIPFEQGKVPFKGKQVRWRKIYVEETAWTTGHFIGENQSSWSDHDNTLNAGNIQVSNTFPTVFQVKEKVTLTSFNFKAYTKLYSSGSATATVTFTVYGASQGNGGYVANTGRSYGTFTAKTEEMTSTNLSTITLEAKGSVTLEPGMYSIAPTKFAVDGPNIEFHLERGRTKLTSSTVDDATGNILQFEGCSQGTSNGNQNYSGYIYNIGFQAAQNYCTRIEVPVYEDCPCTAPGDVTIKARETLCSAGSQKVTRTEFKATINPDPTANATFDFRILKDGATYQDWKELSQIYLKKESNVDNRIKYEDIASSGTTYTVQVRDHAFPNNQSCQNEASITIKPFDPPTFTITGGAAYCEGDESSIAPVKVKLTSGATPFTFSYLENDDDAGYVNEDLDDESNEFSLQIPDETTEYKINYFEDGHGCEAVIDEDNMPSSTITIKPKPEPEIEPVDPVCAGQPITLKAKTIANATYSWTGPNGFTSQVQNPVITTTTTNSAGEYTVTVTVDDCVNTASTTVTIYPIPNKPTLSSNSPICAGADLSITATAPTNVPNNPTFEWEWTGPNSYTAQTKDVSITEATTNATGTYSVTATANGCTSEAATLTYTVNAIPDAPEVNSPSFCVGGDVEALKATGTGTIKWYSTETSNDASSVAPTLSNTAPATTYYYASQTVNDCESPRAMATVTVRDTLAPTITATPGFEVCAKEEIDLKVDGTFATTTWSGTAASSLNATSIQDPTFTAPEVSEAKQYKIKVTVVDSRQCSGSAEKTITVNPIPEITNLSQLSNECVSNETAQTITATVTPAGVTGIGTWTGDVTKVTEFTASYKPSDAGVGTHEIKYDFTSDKNCVAKQKTTSVEVFGMPSPTMSVSNASVCVSGQNSEVVTVSTQGTDQANGTFIYSVDNGGIVDANTGAFDPTANAAKDVPYTITLDYKDGNGCAGTASAQVTVHPLPTVEITSANPTELCYNGSSIQIATTVSPDGGTGVWTGTESSTSNVFDPNVKTVGPNAISYLYTDIYNCQNSDDYSIEVKKPAVPTPGDDVNAMINNGQLNGLIPMQATLNAPADKLQWMPSGDKAVLVEGQSEGTVIAEGISYESKATEVGSYHYLVRSMLTVNGNGCYSDGVMVTTNISACNAMAPKSSDIYVCVGDAMKNFTAVQTSNLVDQKISWLKENPVGKNGTEADSWLLEDATTTFTPTGINTSVAKEHVFYVAEYDKDQNCWSAGTKVTLHVVDNPVVTISSPKDICAVGTEPVPVTVSPETGTLTQASDYGTLNGFQWLPGDYDRALQNHEDVTFTYEVKSDPYLDGTVCSTTKTSTTTAHFMEKPDEVGKSWLIGQIATIPDDLLKGAYKGTGVKMNWYDTQTKSNKLKENSLTYAPDKDALQTEVGSLKTYTKEYWITQVDANGCESAPNKVTLDLLDCPWEAPSVDSIERCLNTTIGDLTATQGASVATMATDGKVTNWIWFDENGNEITSGATKSSWTPTVSNTVPKVSKFSVAYEAVEDLSKVTCRSPKKDVLVTVLDLPTITFDLQDEIVCYTTEALKINVKATPGDNGAGVSNGTGSGVWSINRGDASAISSTGIFYPQVNGQIEGQTQYELTYTYTDGKSCTDKNSRTVDVIYLSAPETEGFFAMTSQTNPVTVKITSTLDAGAEPRWFETQLAMDNAKGTTATWQTGDAYDRVTTDKKYYARQYKDGCYSEPTEAVINIVPCPIPEVTIKDEKACNYDEIPTLSATTGDWADRDGSKSVFKYYTTSTGGSAVKEAADGKYQQSNNEAKEYTYYVSEYNSVPLIGLTNPEGCEGPRKIAKVTITGTGMPSVVATLEDPKVCEGVENPSFVANDVVGVVGWYEEDPGPLGVPQTTKKAEGKRFLPSGRTAGKYQIWAVMYNDGCYGPKVSRDYTIKPIPAEPDVEAAEVCFQENNIPVKAHVASNDIVVNWYQDASKTMSLLKGSTEYTSKETSSGTYTYYATQTKDGCEGSAAPVKYTIKPLPSGPVMTSQPNICAYDDAPILHASGENIKWYSSDKEPLGVVGETYQTEIASDATTSVTHRYYASQMVNGCEGMLSPITFTVNFKPNAPVTTGASVCEGSTEIPSLTTNVSTDKWYADESALTYLATGYTYTPDISEVGNRDKTYYVQRDLNDCVSDVVPVVLHVIQKPQLTISNDTTMCVYDDIVTLKASKFSPVMNDASKVQWQVTKNNVTKYLDSEADNTLKPTTAITGEGVYTVSAVYKYVYDNIYCVSDTMSMKYTVKGRARKPVVFSSVICQGEEIKDLQALGSPKMVWMSLDGAQPAFATGPAYKFQPGQVLDTGTYRFIIYDRNVYDVANDLGCESEMDTVSLTVAPAAKTKLFGRDSVCVGANEQYYTQFTKESSYFWNVTGDHLNYSKDAGSSSVRYVDWMKSGIDTLTVYEQTWAGCEGFDTLIVKIAARPKPAYSWSLPGASNIIELQDSTIQDSLFYYKDGELVGDAVPYTMYWNYGHQGESEDIVDTVINYSNRLLPIQEGDYIHGYNCPILTVENSFGCKEVYKDCIFLELTSSLYVPSAFAPMNPAHSVRTFQPKGYNLKTCEISVYDKWGNLLWYSDAVEDGKFVGYWDGRYDGKMMQSDVYIWKMEATFLDGLSWDGFDVGNGKKAKFGSVTLVR